MNITVKQVLEQVLRSLAAPTDPDQHPRPRSRFVRFLTWLTLPLGLLTLVVVIDVGRHFGGVDIPVLVSAVGAAVAVALLGRRALLAWRVSIVICVMWFVPSLSAPEGQHVWPWPLTIVLAASFLIVTMRYRRAVAWGTWGWTALVLLLGGRGAAGVGWLLALTVVAVVVDARRQRSRAQVEARLEREARARQEERSVVLEERARIARDLHDVVAHHMSMVAVQAESARFRLDGLDDATLAELASIAGSARAALSDVRGILTVLRGDGEAERAPQPTLAELADLVDASRNAGAQVRLDVTGARRGLPAVLEISAYRIVQESLANAARHAPGAAVVVTVHYGEHELAVTVSNGPPPGLPARGEPVAGDGGHGLTGMVERAELLGGRLRAGPDDDGGFQVEAHLPVPLAPTRASHPALDAPPTLEEVEQ